MHNKQTRRRSPRPWFHRVLEFGRPRRRGFTLVELLVIISILALLIAILLPSLRRARRQAKRVVCQTNLKQIAVAWHLYLVDYQGRFLKGVNVNWNYGGQQGAVPAFGDPDHPKFKPLNPFLKLPLVATQVAAIFRCPEDRGGGGCTDHAFRAQGNELHDKPDVDRAHTSVGKAIRPLRGRGKAGEQAAAQPDAIADLRRVETDPDGRR